MPARETRFAREKRTTSRSKRVQNEEALASEELATKECTSPEAPEWTGARDPLDDCFVCGTDCTLPSEPMGKDRIMAELRSSN
jgi:hypothetical protein